MSANNNLIYSEDNYTRPQAGYIFSKWSNIVANNNLFINKFFKRKEHVK